jgi:hypothetical protein
MQNGIIRERFIESRTVSAKLPLIFAELSYLNAFPLKIP